MLEKIYRTESKTLWFVVRHSTNSKLLKFTTFSTLKYNHCQFDVSSDHFHWSKDNWSNGEWPKRIYWQHCKLKSTVFFPTENAPLQYKFSYGNEKKSNVFKGFCVGQKLNTVLFDWYHLFLTGHCCSVFLFFFRHQRDVITDVIRRGVVMCRLSGALTVLDVCLKIRQSKSLSSGTLLKLPL